MSVRREAGEGVRRRLRAPGRGRGAATAEAATVLPVLLSFGLVTVWLLALAVTQLRVVDAAREAARAAARDEPDPTAVAAGRRVAPEGSTIVVTRRGDEVVVRVEATVRGPGGLFGFLPSPRLRAEAVTRQEAP